MSGPLDRRKLGRTGLNVTVLGFGAMELRGGVRGRRIPEHDVDRLLHSVLDQGINFVDTSIDYGASEERIGRAIGCRREEFILATKCGCVVGWEPSSDTPGPGPHDYRPENLVAGVEQSLRRLRTDYLDLVQLHGSPTLGDLERHDAIATLECLRETGKVRHIGISSTLPNLADHLDTDRFETFQVPYSLVQREHERWLTRLAGRGAGVIVRGGVAKGVPGHERFDDVDARGPAAKLAQEWRRIELEDLRAGMSAMEFTLRFTISHSQVSTTIVGTLDPEHLRDNVVAASKGPLPNDVMEEARRRLDEAGLSAVE